MFTTITKKKSFDWLEVFSKAYSVHHVKIALKPYTVLQRNDYSYHIVSLYSVYFFHMDMKDLKKCDLIQSTLVFASGRTCDGDSGVIVKYFHN